MRALTLLLLIGIQDQTPLPKEPIKDWRYQLKDLRHDPKTKTDVEEITLILFGKEAIPRSLVKEKEIFDLKGIDARYFTTPGRGDPKSRQILVTADRGSIDKGARTLKLNDNVRVVRKGDPEKNEIDTILTTPSALLRFNRMYECPVCRKAFGAAGRCPEHGEPLRETTITSVETDREFGLTGPEGILSGIGLATDDAIRKEYHIARVGFIEFAGDVDTVAARQPAEAPQTLFTQVYSRGPLSITGPEDQRVIHGEGGVRVDRIDVTETLTLTAETLTIDTVRRWELSKTGPVELRNVHAEGNVVLDGVSFTDGDSFTAVADRLDRQRDFDKDTDITLLTAAAPRVVRLTRIPSWIESRSVRIERTETDGTVSTFDEVLSSDLVTGTQHFSLAGDRLVTVASPDAAGKMDLRTLHVIGHVVLGGLMAQAEPATPDSPPGEAHADDFRWDIATGRGLLQGRPFVRIVQGDRTITAPLVVLESADIIVLKGPKQVHLVQMKDGQKQEYRATCEGDLVMDNHGHRLWMRNACVLRSQEILLRSERIDATLSPEGKGLESLLALGNVRAVRTADQDRKSVV